MGELELSLSDFILGLIKLALMYRALGLGPSDESDSGADGYESSGPPPAHRVLAWLLREKVLRHGKKEDLDAFRKEFWAPTVQNAINPYWYPLKVRSLQPTALPQPVRPHSHTAMQRRCDCGGVPTSAAERPVYSTRLT